MMRNDFQSDYLMHHGILGQKWGVRRYQNPDGSLTSAGRERYGVKEGGSVSDISTAKGYNRRVKDLKKAIKKNEKKRGKEHTKIANNPENFMGMNKKHAKKIEEYSENIRKGEEEIKKLFAKAESEGYDVKRGKVKGEASEESKKYTELVSKRYSKEDSTIIADHKNISSSLAKDMVSDLKRWQKEGSSQIPASLKNKSDSEIQNILASKIQENIKNYDADSIYKFKDDTVSFVIDGIPEYSDSQPLTVEYDVEKKKVKNFYYT